MKDEFIPPERIDRDSFFAGLCMGIMADGAINRLEAWALFDWLVHNDMPHLENIKKELEESLVEDGKFGSKAGKKLSGHLEKLLGKTLPAWLRAKQMPVPAGFYHGLANNRPLHETANLPGLFDRPEKIDPEAAYCFTGIFAFGRRPEVEKEAIQCGAEIVQQPVSDRKCYVVVGSVASPDWAHGNYGRKVEKAIQWRTEGKPIQIISEDFWMERLFCALE